MTTAAQPQIQLQPLEWAIVHALRASGPLTTSALLADLAERGYTPSRGTLRSQLATLTRFTVITREAVGSGGRCGGESRYRMRL